MSIFKHSKNKLKYTLYFAITIQNFNPLAPRNSQFNYLTHHRVYKIVHNQSNLLQTRQTSKQRFFRLQLQFYLEFCILCYSWCSIKSEKMWRYWERRCNQPITIWTIYHAIMIQIQVQMKNKMKHSSRNRCRTYFKKNGQN